MIASTPNEKSLARMKKLLELARRGVGGEAENAQRFLERMLASHGMTLADIEADNQRRALARFKYRDSVERNLLVQIFSKVLNTSDFPVFKRKGAKFIGAELTPAERAEAVMYHAALAPALKKHLELAYSAFIQKNEVFKDSSDEVSPNKELDEAERQRMIALAAMMNGTERVAVHKMLPGPAP